MDADCVSSRMQMCRARRAGSLEASGVRQGFRRPAFNNYLIADGRGSREWTRMAPHRRAVASMEGQFLSLERQLGKRLVGRRASVKKGTWLLPAICPAGPRPSAAVSAVIRVQKLLAFGRSLADQLFATTQSRMAADRANGRGWLLVAESAVPQRADSLPFLELTSLEASPACRASVKKKIRLAAHHLC
jgi:hypothetical protein